jgi:hypothetical protein
MVGVKGKVIRHDNGNFMSQHTSLSIDTREEIHDFLETYDAPIRISGVAQSGYPIICSLWFEYADNALWCATQKTAKIARVLSDNPKCAFELAPNTPPYFGIRGQGNATLQIVDADKLLERLIDRYLGDRNSKLARMLLKKAADEVAMRIEIEQITSWDYRSRMK